jgi:hypothetical protein
MKMNQGEQRGRTVDGLIAAAGFFDRYGSILRRLAATKSGWPRDDESGKDAKVAKTKRVFRSWRSWRLGAKNFF